ncbi:ATPase [Leptospira langatensis]|uniref:ATPase n=1 Tax=Leptospira langatensis TaxID=2484983 RepID=A0A5F1ZQM2_9LEPT|nr:SRPBCC family protein [Leptospira langatensis]TGK01831.1 ATPase [Leptospira langatensis]TGL39436.1 ATPase [Leptospira langatensis]
METKSGVKVEAQGEREILMTREFNAPRDLVFECHTKPELIKRWLLGPDGWIMDVCDVDLRVGGKYRYVWKKIADGTMMGMGGTYKVVSRPESIHCTEIFDEAWYAGEALVQSSFTEKNERTTLKVTILYNSKETRDMVLKSPMESGVAASYNRLEDLLISSKAKG